MADDAQLIEAFDAQAPEERNERRAFFRAALGAAAAGAGALALAERASAQTVTDVDTLNFFLNLAYLEGQFYSWAANGSGLDSTLLTGTGTAGSVTGGAKVTFADATISAYAQEFAKDGKAHVTFLRAQLGTANAVAMPTVDIGGTDPAGAFSKLAQAAGIVAAGTAFNPYASDDNFLLAAMMLTDLTVSAYAGLVPTVLNRIYTEAAAGIMATKATQAATIRSTLYARGATTPSLRTNADGISNARDGYDGATDLDQGISPVTINGGAASNIVPADSDGLVLARTAALTLNVLYLNSTAATSGGFFPAGTNGNIKTANAN